MVYFSSREEAIQAMPLCDERAIEKITVLQQRSLKRATINEAMRFTRCSVAYLSRTATLHADDASLPSLAKTRGCLPVFRLINGKLCWNQGLLSYVQRFRRLIIEWQRPGQQQKTLLPPNHTEVPGLRVLRYTASLNEVKALNGTYKAPDSKSIN